MRAVGEEQSNSSVVFGERVILKAYRRLEPGESAELELLRFLAARGFEHAPELLGWYRYDGSRLTTSLGILQTFLPGARDGWSDALGVVRPARAVPRTAAPARRGDCAPARGAGKRPCGPCVRARAPRRRGPRAGGEAGVASARALLAGLRPGGPAEPVRARGDDVLKRLRAAWRQAAGGQAIRQHGDYHLGQVLWAHDDWQLLDFEGEPASPLPERRRKSSPLRDVAGMLRSFAYAAETGRSHGDGPAARWETDARAAFVGGYEAHADEALLPPAGVSSRRTADGLGTAEGALRAALRARQPA